MKWSKHEHEDWEALCKQCGLCCFTKYDEGNGKIFHTSIPCRYLDVVTRRCKIYPRRFEIYPDCIKLTEESVRTIPWLHDECAYVCAIRKGERPRTQWTRRLSVGKKRS